MLNERVVYLNGEFVPESRASISFRDAGFVFGDAVYDTARTFDGKIFKLKEHVERLYDTLRYVRIDPGLSPAEMSAATEELVERNLPLLRNGEDYWVSQRISRGLMPLDGEPPTQEGPTVVIESQPIPLRKRAKLYRDGIHMVTPSVRRTPPQSLSPRAKTTNYLNMIMGAQEVAGHGPNAWAVLLDINGNICEGVGANVFFVRDGVALTPREDFVLPGISRQTVIEICADIGIPCEEKDLAMHDAYIADEAFITSTSLCLCPISQVNGQPLRDSGIPGPVTKRIMDRYAALVGTDFVQQYLAFLPD